MTKPHLSTCPSCARHVRVSEAACPFCSAVLDDAFRARSAPRAPASRLSRAALYAFGASSITLAACSSTDDPKQKDPVIEPAYGGPPLDGGQDVQQGALYGAPPLDASQDTSPPIVDAAYGGPPIDASGDADADVPVVDAAYGGPPIDAGTD